MLIQCEKCHQTYNVPDEMISADSLCFKCSACGHTFYIEREDVPPPASSFEDNPVVYTENPDAQPTTDSEAFDAQIQHEIHSDELMRDEKQLFNPAAEISKKDDVPFLKDEPDTDNPLTSPTFLPDNEDVFAPQKDKTPVSLWGRVTAFVVILIIFTGACLFMTRGFLYERVTWTRPIYALFGYTPVLKGVSLENLKMQYIKDEQGTSVGVRIFGQIENQKDHSVPVPLVRARLLDENEQMVNFQYVPIRREVLNAAEKLPFDVVLSLPEGAVYVDVSLDEKP